MRRRRAIPLECNTATRRRTSRVSTTVLPRALIRPTHTLVTLALMVPDTQERVLPVTLEPLAHTASPTVPQVVVRLPVMPKPSNLLPRRIQGSALLPRPPWIHPTRLPRAPTWPSEQTNAPEADTTLTLTRWPHHQLLLSRPMPLLLPRNKAIQPLLTHIQVRLLLRATRCSPRIPSTVVQVNQQHKDIPRPHSMKKPPVLALPRHQQILKQIPVVPPAADVVSERATGTAQTDTTDQAAGKRCVSRRTEAGSLCPSLSLPELDEALRPPRECDDFCIMTGLHGVRLIFLGSTISSFSVSSGYDPLQRFQISFLWLVPPPSCKFASQ